MAHRDEQEPEWYPGAVGEISVTFFEGGEPADVAEPVTVRVMTPSGAVDGPLTATKADVGTYVAEYRPSEWKVHAWQAKSADGDAIKEDTFRVYKSEVDEVLPAADFHLNENDRAPATVTVPTSTEGRILTLWLIATHDASIKHRMDEEAGAPEGEEIVFTLDLKSDMDGQKVAPGSSYWMEVWDDEDRVRVPAAGEDRLRLYVRNMEAND